MAFLFTRKIKRIRLRIVLLAVHCLLLTAYCLLLTDYAYAERQVSLSIVEGYYLPRFGDLNYILKYKDVELGPRNTEAKPFPYPVIYQGYSPDGMPEMRPKAPKTGLQLQVELTPRYAVFFGNSIAVYDSEKRDVRPFFVGFNIPSDRVTRFSLSLNQLWFGVKRYWTFKEKPEVKSQKSEEGSKKQKESPPLEKGGTGGFEAAGKPDSRFYVEMGVLAVTMAHLTTDVWLHVYAPEEGFDFYKVTETESEGNGYVTFLGLGGEYFIKNWLSVGLDADYTLGKIRKFRFKRYFTVDPLEKDIIKPGEIVNYTDLRKGAVVPFNIDLEGVDIKGQVRFYF